MLDTLELRPKADQVAALLKALAHSDRLLLLCEMAGAHRRGGCTVSELVKSCGISQSLTSQFLARLKSEGWIEFRREGKAVRYRIADLKVLELLSTLTNLFCRPESTDGSSNDRSLEESK